MANAAKLLRTSVARLRWQHQHGVGAELSDPATMARAGAYLFGSGATLALIWLFLPVSGHVDVAAMGGLVGASYAMVVLLVVGWDRIPEWGFRAFLVGFTLLVSGFIFYSGKSTSPYAFFYVWAALYALYFFSLADAVRHVVFMGFCYAAVLVAHHSAGNTTFADFVIAVEDSAAQWTVAFGTLVVATALFGLLKERLDALIERLTDAVRTDPLTGLLNRRGFEEAFELEVERARRTKVPLTLLVGDLDRFKMLNDRLGHPAGDRALELLGEALTSGVRRIDRVGRMGGEEFALVLPETDEHEGYVLAERLRAKIRENFQADIFPLTISFGVAAYPTHGATTSGLLKAADQALYTAKEFGRDCSVIYSAETAEILRGNSHRRESTAERRVASLVGLASSMDTAEHSQMVGRYTKLIAIELELASELVERVQLAGVLHDIGKVGVADSIVNKPGPLTPEEWDEMRKHPEFGARMLERAELWDIAAWVAAHHERPDGKGYPLGLKDEEIPLEARIVAVADAYEAMTTDRVYRPGIGHTAARAELRRGAGNQFDARVVQAFLKAHEPAQDTTWRIVSGRAVAV
ncbi:MAG TPA: diguanylate cyclase [Thermoleophilaceae bacterium]|nr:diguanylate cyclase [Thermoleophilaceae bacterium]